MVDRMIIENGKITLIDYKTGLLDDFLDAYLEQARRYGTIMKSVFPGKAIEAFLLLVDDEKRVVAIVL